MDAKSRVRVISMVLFVSVFAVWVVYYVVMSHYLAAVTEKQMELAADQIIERLGREFNEVERLSYGLRQDVLVQALVREQDPHAFFALIDGMDADMGRRDSGFINGVVLFGADGHGYRLIGTLGNKACSILYGAASALDLPSHLSVELDGWKYIGYADEVAPSGKVVVLIEEEKILEVVRAYDQSGSLMVAVRANGEVVTSNTNLADGVEGLASPVIRSNLGVTPYEIVVAANEGYRDATLIPFSLAALITAALFAIVLFLYTGVLNRRFFRPMVSVIGSIKQLQADAGNESLPHVQSKEFDELIDKFNEMIRQIEIKNAEVMAAEIGRQKALVLSLQKQINAHFTVNTMGAIRAAVKRGEVEEAEVLMSGLTRIVRYAHSKEEAINVWDEMEILEYYTSIMNSRYGGKLTAEFDFDEDLMEVHMPRMLLQPLVENAVVHGFKDMDSGCFVHVGAELVDGVMRFTVSDNGCGMDEGELSALRERLRTVPDNLEELEHIAILNVKNRLYYYYGEAARLDICARVGGGIEATIEIPAPTGAETGGVV